MEPDYYGWLYPAFQSYLRNMGQMANYGQQAAMGGGSPGPNLGGQLLGQGQMGFANQMQNAMGQMAQVNARNQDATIQNNAIKGQVLAPALTEAVRQQGQAARAASLAQLLGAEANNIGRTSSDYAGRIGSGLNRQISSFLGG